jgi:hypothetical protein
LADASPEVLLGAAEEALQQLLQGRPAPEAIAAAGTLLATLEARHGPPEPARQHRCTGPHDWHPSRSWLSAGSEVPIWALVCRTCGEEAPLPPNGGPPFEVHENGFRRRTYTDLPYAVAYACELRRQTPFLVELRDRAGKILELPPLSTPAPTATASVLQPPDVGEASESIPNTLPQPAEIGLNGWGGLWWQKVLVIGETRQRYRIKSPDGERVGLARGRSIRGDETALVPKHAVRFQEVRS